MPLVDAPSFDCVLQYWTNHPRSAVLKTSCVRTGEESVRFDGLSFNVPGAPRVIKHQQESVSSLQFNFAVQFALTTAKEQINDRVALFFVSTEIARTKRLERTNHG